MCLLDIHTWDLDMNIDTDDPVDAITDAKKNKSGRVRVDATFVTDILVRSLIAIIRVRISHYNNVFLILIKPGERSQAKERADGRR